MSDFTFRSYGVAAAVLLAAVSVARAQDAAAFLPPAPVVGKTYPVHAEGQNKGVRLTVSNAALLGRYGALKPAAGRALLVVRTEWENVFPTTDVATSNNAASTAYKIPNLADLLYLVTDGRRAARMNPAAAKLPGHVKVLDFTVAKIGDVVAGNVVFDVPAGRELGQAELRFYDATNGSIVVPLADPATPPPGDTKPLDEGGNGVLAAGIYGLTRSADLDGKPAPPGTEFVTVDLRARSLAIVPAAGSTPARPTVADWNEANRHVSILVDGVYQARPAATALPDAPRLLPDLATGGLITFRVPKNARNLDVVLDFPRAVVNARTVWPNPIELRGAGSRPSRPDLKPVVPPVVDDVFFVAVTNVESRGSFAGQPAGDGKRFLVVDVVVANTGKADENFQPREQLKYLTSTGEPVPMDAVAADGPRNPAEPTLVPEGGRRGFQAVYRVPTAEPALRLAYAGVSKGAIIPLPGGTGEGAVAGAKPPPPATGPAESAAAPRPDEAAVLTAAASKTAFKPDQPIDRRGRKFPSRVKAKQPLTPKGLAGVGLTNAQVNAAIDRGAAALWARRVDELAKQPNSKFGDVREDLITALALVHSGFHKKQPAFDTALRVPLKKYDPDAWHGTYENGLVCMILEGYGDAAFAPQLGRGAQWIVDQQGPLGTWNYGKYRSPDELAAATGPRKVLSVVGGRPPEQAAAGRTTQRRTAAIDYTDGDNSTSQYALLGLHAAGRGGLKFPRDTFVGMLAATRDRQCDNGSWAYTTSSTGYGSMTAAGICAVALTRYELGEKEPWNDQAIERGLAWLNAYFSVEDHPESSGSWLYYYLYSLERVGRILDTEFIGEHEWYPLGAKFLLEHQRANGLWWADRGDEAEPHAEIATSFALLFLTRATPNLSPPPEPTGPGRLQTLATLPPGNRLYVILDCSGSMLDAMDGRPKFDIAKDAVRTLLKDVPDNSEVALRAYGYRLRAIQPGASEDTKLLVPLKPLDRTEMAGFIDGLRARGKTPLAFSLDEAAKDLAGVATAAKPVTAVLLTDGGEDSQPRRDPVAAAAAFGAIPNVSLRIVGFDINRDDWSQQLAAMAAAGRGQYLPAAQGVQLQTELRTAVFGIPEFARITDAAGRPVRMLPFGQTTELPPGKYVFATTFGGQAYEQPFYVSPGETTAITFDSAAIAEEAAAARAAEAANAKPPAADTPPAGPAAGPTPAAPASTFCKNCKMPLKPGAKFCTRCGTKVGP